MWAAVNELYGGLSASTAMPGFETYNRDHHCIAVNDGLTKMCEHKQECDEENHPARDHFRRHKESQPGEANLGRRELR